MEAGSSCGSYNFSAALQPKKGSLWRGDLLVVILWQPDIRRACCYSSTAKAAKLSQQTIYRPSWADKSLPNGS